MQAFYYWPAIGGYRQNGSTRGDQSFSPLPVWQSRIGREPTILCTDVIVASPLLKEQPTRAFDTLNEVGNTDQHKDFEWTITLDKLHFAIDIQMQESNVVTQ